ncbi:MAG: hypothetical protein AAF959_23495 [Cyanobacteria bacterium P01_D01_bin.56]
MTAPIDMTGATGTTTLETDFVAAPDLVKQLFIMATHLLDEQTAYNDSQGTAVNNVALATNPVRLNGQVTMPITGASIYSGPIWENVGDFGFTAAPLSVPGGSGDAATFDGLSAPAQFAMLAAKLNEAEMTFNLANPTNAKQGIEITTQQDSTVLLISFGAPVDPDAKFYNLVQDYLV